MLQTQPSAAASLQQQTNEGNAAQPTAAAIVDGKDAAATSITEQRLQLSYVLPNGEAATPPPVVSTSGTANADLAAKRNAETIAWSSSHILPVTDALVRDMASSSAALAVTVSAAIRVVSNPSEAAAVPAPSPAKPAAKPGKNAPVPEEVPCQAEQKHIGTLDLAPLLVGDTEVAVSWPQKGLAMPAALQAYQSFRLRLQVCFSSLIYMYASACDTITSTCTRSSKHSVVLNFSAITS